MTDETASGFRSYEVYQRERVGETTNLVNPRDLIADRYLADPFTVSGVLREHYPCFRDWVGNRFWLTRYDDVTSVFVDDANFETRPLRAAYGTDISGRDLSYEPSLVEGRADINDAALEAVVGRVVDELPTSVDLSAEFVDRLSRELFSTVLGLDPHDTEVFDLVLRMQRGAGWNETWRIEGLGAFAELRRSIAAQLVDHKATPNADLLTVFADVGATSEDIAITLLESDLATLPASLANLWSLLLAHPDQLDAVRSEPRLMKFAYLEALRHSPPSISADRFARHEVERFGRLIPQGARMHLSAGAANRDPRQFQHGDEFDISRKDLCQREPRGQFRADGLPAAVVFGHGPPSRKPAQPKEGARSRYALTRDIAVHASLALLARFPDITLTADAHTAPVRSLDRLGGTYRCRELPVTLRPHQPSR